MVAYSEVLYNITEAKVALLANDNTYGTPVAIDYLQTLTFEYEADTDEIMSGGLIVETLAIVKKATGEVSNAAMNWAAMAVMCGLTAGDYGTTPNQYGVMDFAVGGAGLPYFGLIMRAEATLGGNVIIGFPKAKLQTYPGFEMDQNKFRLGSAGFDAVAPSTTVRKAVRVKKNETAGSVPTSAADFLAFFTTPPPSLFG